MSDSHSTVKYKVGSATFELLIKSSTILKFRRGKATADDILITDEIFSNAAKGEKTNIEDIETAFKTRIKEQVIATILEKGHAPLSTAERKEVTEEKRAQILGYIHRFYVSPVNGLPHPMTRIEAAVETAKCRIDHEKPVDAQRDAIIKKLIGILPLKKTEMEVLLRIPTGRMGSVSGLIYNSGTVTNESWTGGSWTGHLAIVPGEFDHLMSKLQSALKDDLDFELPGFDKNAGKEEPAKGRGKGKGKGKRRK